MRYLIDITQRQSDRIQELLDKGQYASFSQFVSTAIENQFSLEDDTSNMAGAIIKESKHLNSQPVLNPHSQTKSFEYLKANTLSEITRFLKQPSFNEIVLSTQKLKESEVWIWGQINKIFPVKIGVRVLHKNSFNGGGVELNHFLDSAAKYASEIGSIIKNYEKNENKDRDDKISAGLPLSADEKSQIRYKYQFLAYLRRDNILDGAMAILRFCNIERKNGKIFIGLTQSGYDFSSLINPVLDEGDLDTSLSRQEVDYYINYIKNNVNSEYTAIIWMIRRINEGINDRESLNKELLEDYGKIWKCSEMVINTQRAGLIARMFELGLISKEKDGVRVTYKLTNLSKSLI